MDSLRLQRQVQSNANLLQEYCKDLKQWGDEMKRKDESKTSTDGNNGAPLPRGKVPKLSEPTPGTSKSTAESTNCQPKKKKRIPSYDYKAWDKFDVDAYCAKMDDPDNEELSDESELSDEIDEGMIDFANSEKEKGNLFVKKQRWDDAIKCYTKAIESYAYDPIFYANRALCYLKKENYRSAESDCTIALQLDKSYVKAFQRRAVARENLNQLSEAHGDLLKVLKLEPKNKESAAALVKLEKKLENFKQTSTDTQRPVSKFTLSRQKYKNPFSTQEDAKLENVYNNKKETPPVKDHVIENVSRDPTLYASQAPTNTDTQINKAEEQKSEIIKPIKRLDWPSGTNVELFKPINKPPNSRSKKPLRRVEIIDTDIKTEKQRLNDLKLSEGIENTVKEDICRTDGDDNLSILEKTDDNSYEASKFEKKEVLLDSVNILEQLSNDTKKMHSKYLEESSIIKTDTNENKMLDLNNTVIVEKLQSNDGTIDKIDQENDACINDDFQKLNLGIPTTSVQFYNAWKIIKMSQKFKYLYLVQIKPADLPVIFKESLESKVFSDIIETLAEAIPDNDGSLYEYLFYLSDVKRFGALVMFMSSKDKLCMLKLIEHMKQNTKYTPEEVAVLIRRYKI